MNSLQANDDWEDFPRLQVLVTSVPGYVRMANWVPIYSMREVDAYVYMEELRKTGFPHKLSFKVAKAQGDDLTPEDGPVIALENALRINLQFQRWTLFSERPADDYEVFHFMFSHDEDAVMFKMVYPS